MTNYTRPLQKILKGDSKMDGKPATTLGFHSKIAKMPKMGAQILTAVRNFTTYGETLRTGHKHRKQMISEHQPPATALSDACEYGQNEIRNLL